MRVYLLILLVVTMFSCNGKSGSSNGNDSAGGGTNTQPPVVNSRVPTYGYEVVNVYPHDKKAFTQGLVYHNGFLYESTGQYGQSSLRKVELETGRVLQKREIDDDYFAEGMTILGGKVFQLTWRSNIGFVYDLADFKPVKEIRYNGEGWGLTNDGTNLYMTDSTHIIRVVDPETFNIVRTIVVLDEDGKPLMNLNELEYIKGEIWANIWHSEKIDKPNHIARIDPKDGKLLGWVNLNFISPEDSGRDEENTLNGIAYDEKGDRIFITGKNWAKLFEIELKPES